MTPDYVSLHPGYLALFDPDWSLAQVEYEITMAIKNSKPDPLRPGAYTGKTPSGIKMQLFPPNPTIPKWRGWPLDQLD